MYTLLLYSVTGKLSTILWSRRRDVEDLFSIIQIKSVCPDRHKLCRKRIKTEIWSFLRAKKARKELIILIIFLNFKLINLF